jgi:RNA polymerase sigma-70 factor (ECF subfamily)
MKIDINAYYKKYLPLLYRRCKTMLRNGEDALDAVQDVFLRLLEAGDALEDRYPSSLLYTMATNVCINRIRRKMFVMTEELREDGGRPELVSVDSGFEEAEARVLSGAILKDEDELTRSICFMYFADGMTLREIGAAAGLSVSGVRKRLLAFRSRARIWMGKKGRSV